MTSATPKAGRSRRHFIRDGALLAGAATFDGIANAAPTRHPVRPGRFQGKVAFITGGARGQGRANAEQLAREGADIVLCDAPGPINSIDYPLATAADLAEIRSRIEQLGRRCIAQQADIRDAAAMKALVERAVEEFGRVDLMVANAAILSLNPLATLSDEAWDELIKTNLYGTFYSIRAVLPQMIEQQQGRIVVISSMAGRGGIPHMAHYCASKWGVIGLAKSLALEVAKQGITVNAVCPTGIATDMIINQAAFKRALPDKPQPTREDYTAYMRAQTSSPMGAPWVEPEDVSNAVLFLLSDEARYITGEAMTVAAGGIAMNSA